MKNFIYAEEHYSFERAWLHVLDVKEQYINHWNEINESVESRSLDLCR